jgi:hypothetical protein
MGPALLLLVLLEPTPEEPLLPALLTARLAGQVTIVKLPQTSQHRVLRELSVNQQVILLAHNAQIVQQVRPVLSSVNRLNILVFTVRQATIVQLEPFIQLLILAPPELTQMISLLLHPVSARHVLRVSHVWLVPTLSQSICCSVLQVTTAQPARRLPLLILAQQEPTQTDAI